jgi:2-phosphosulfolactate phosphatase
VHAAGNAERILLGGLINRRAVAEAICGTLDLPVWIICSGTDGEIAGEDVLAAGAIIHALQDADPTLQLGNDSALLAIGSWKQFSGLPSKENSLAVSKAFRQFRGGSNLVENGYESDLEFSAQIDKIQLAPVTTDESKETFIAFH